MVRASTNPIDLDWDDLNWSDPDGGVVYLHGVLPTVVFSNSLRPRYKWDGLGLMVSEEEIELWEHEEELEKKSPGINFTGATSQGGDFSRLLGGLSLLEEIQTCRFPDPEPRRLQKYAQRGDKPVFYIEPSLSDDDWNTWLEMHATEITRPLKILSNLWSGRKFKKNLSKMMKNVKVKSGESHEFAVASAISAAWWIGIEDKVSIQLKEKRDLRYASRIRGSLLEMRNSGIHKPTLLIVCNMAQRQSLLNALENMPAAEVPLCTESLSDLNEEE
ncbi:MAG: hypothetical protein CMB64_03235 [Euryarchaeota archaeon]|nr:hypothetical protein [Euryarchaeota archaeon]|tara:strand:+ start:1545 stop:2366 length:822 start_codon:yes stop_codon:yes gene_type:complete